MRVGTAIRAANWPGLQSRRRTQSAPRVVRTRGRCLVRQSLTLPWVAFRGGGVSFHFIVPLSPERIVKRWRGVNNTRRASRSMYCSRSPARRKCEPENRGNRAFSERPRGRGWRWRWRRWEGNHSNFSNAAGGRGCVRRWCGRRQQPETLMANL